jgi:triphosphoribosyl-dephospho-CoA synthetase
MADSSDRKAREARPPLRFMRLRDLVDTSDDVIQFVERYQKVWEAEGKAMIALGEFLTLRSESMRYQVEMMKMGNDAFKRYNDWLEALMSLRPDTLLSSILGPSPKPAQKEAAAMDDDRDEDAT